jgi:hypothetical protein
MCKNPVIRDEEYDLGTLLAVGNIKRIATTENVQMCTHRICLKKPIYVHVLDGLLCKPVTHL